MASRAFVVLILLFGILLGSCLSLEEETPKLEKSKAEIAETMKSQENAWNRGDLVSFMNGYWESDSLIFIGSSGVNKGWQKTLENYQSGYPNSQTMGQLKFTNMSYQPLGNKHYIVIGKWYLTRDSLEDLSGHYSLIWERIHGKWVIVTDHSS